MITGRQSGGGKYSYQARSCGNRMVYVSKMPEESFKIRIAFTENGETVNPVLRLSDSDAQLLWAALNATAKELNWKDYSDGKNDPA